MEVKKMVKKAWSMMILMLVFLYAGTAMADVAVSWTSPQPGNYCIGDCVTPTGSASGSGQTGGTGLDLILVLDTSGSMAGAGITALKSAAIALVNSLPSATTQLGIVEFDSSASLYRQLTTLTADRLAWAAAINALGTGGVTATGVGIQTATTELTGPRAIAGHAKMEVVVSDGNWNSGVSPITAATAAYSSGITVHTVGVPGHDATEMSQIAAAGHGVYTNVTNLDGLEDLFAGTTGNLVGLDHVDITLPDGTILADYTTDTLGNFVLPDWTMEAGANTFIATAYDTAGNYASASLTLNGVNCNPDQPVPEPSTLLLLLGALPSLAILRRRFSR